MLCVIRGCHMMNCDARHGVYHDDDMVSNLQTLFRHDGNEIGEYGSKVALVAIF